METVNLGQVGAIHKGTSAPSNTNLIWCDTTNPLSPIFKTYQGGVWVDNNSSSPVWINTNPVSDSIGGYVAGQPATPPGGLSLQEAFDKLLVADKPPVINSFSATPSSIAFNRNSYSVVLNWSIAAFNDSSTITNILVEHRRNNSGSWTSIYTGNGNTYTHSGIPNSSNQVNNYRITALASNSKTSSLTLNVSHNSFVTPTALFYLNESLVDFFEEVGRPTFECYVDINNTNSSAPITALRLYRSINGGSFTLLQSTNPNTVSTVYTYNDTFAALTFNSSLRYKVEIDTAGGTTAFNSCLCSFTNKIYAGNLTVTNPDEATIESLTTVSGLFSELPSEFNFNGVTGYKGIFYPTSIIAPTSYRQTTIDGIPFAMRDRGVVSITNIHGHTSNYYADITQNIFNGAVKILPKYN